MTELINIKVIQKDIDWTKRRFVNARELYKWLWVWRDFSNWIKDRISKYDFVEDLDFFVTVAKFGDGVKARSDGQIIDAKTGKVIPKDYVISIDMAKELAMVENNDMGKKARKYFIRVEDDFKKVMQIATSDPKFINQLAEGFMEIREETKEYRRDFTDSIRDFVEVKNYGTYTDMLYDFLFLEKAKEYRDLLSLVREDFTRNSMYQEILLIIWAFETGLSWEVENKYKTLWRCLTKNEFIDTFHAFSSNKMWRVYQKRARNIMSTYDEELRNIKHPKLIDYRKEFTNEDIKRLLE
jgi:phage anti-repressor protein